MSNAARTVTALSGTTYERPPSLARLYPDDPPTLPIPTRDAPGATAFAYPVPDENVVGVTVVLDKTTSVVLRARERKGQPGVWDLQPFDRNPDADLGIDAVFGPGLMGALNAGRGLLERIADQEQFASVTPPALAIPLTRNGEWSRDEVTHVMEAHVDIEGGADDLTVNLRHMSGEYATYIAQRGESGWTVDLLEDTVDIEAGFVAKYRTPESRAEWAAAIQAVQRALPRYLDEDRASLVRAEATLRQDREFCLERLASRERPASRERVEELRDR